MITPLVSSTSSPTAMNTSLLPTKTMTHDQIKQIMKDRFAAFEKELSNLAPQIKKLPRQEIKAFLQKEMDRIQERIQETLCPTVRLTACLPMNTLQTQIVPLLDLKSFIPLALTCKTYYWTLQQNAFWKSLVEREVVYPVLDIPTQSSREYSPVFKHCYYIHKRGFSYLNKIDNSVPGVQCPHVKFHTKNTDGDIVILKTNKELYLLRNKELHRLPDFPISTSESTNATNGLYYMALGNTIVRVFVESGLKQKTETPLRFTVHQWDYMKGQQVVAFSGTTMVPSRGYIFPDHMRVVRGKDISEIVFSSQIMKKVGDTAYSSTGNISTTTINLKSQTMKTIKELDNRDRVSLIKNGNYINKQTGHLSLYSEKGTKIRQLDLLHGNNNVRYEVSPDETFLAAVQISLTIVSVSAEEFLAAGNIRPADATVTLWDLYNGEKQSIRISIPIQCTSVYDHIKKFKWVSQKLLLMILEKELVIINTVNKDILRMNLTLEKNESVVDVLLDSSGLLVVTQGNDKCSRHPWGNLASYYPLFSAAMRDQL